MYCRCECCRSAVLWFLPSLPRCTRLSRKLWHIAIHVHRDYDVDTARDLTLLTPFLVKPHRSFSRKARRSWCLKFPCASSSSSSNQSVAAHLDLSSYGLRLAFTTAHALLNSCVPSLRPSPSLRCHTTWLLRLPQLCAFLPLVPSLTPCLP